MTFGVNSRLFLAFISLVTLAFLLTLSPVFAANPAETHLGVRSNQVVNIHTFSLPNDNTSWPFYYDRAYPQLFEPVPQGYSFVVTDLIFQPQTSTLDPNQQYLIVVTIGTGRSFIARFFGSSQHYALSGALVIPGGSSVTARNTTLSADNAEVQLIGYFVKGEGLGYGVPAF